MFIGHQHGLFREWQIGLVLLVGLVMPPGGYADAPGDGARPAELRQAVHEAAHEVDFAWDIFHEAALGGTLASPGDQAEIERSLHESRTLLLQLREALDRTDWEQIHGLLRRLHELTAKAIGLSRKRKP